MLHTNPPAVNAIRVDVVVGAASAVPNTIPPISPLAARINLSSTVDVIEDKTNLPAPIPKATPATARAPVISFAPNFSWIMGLTQDSIPMINRPWQAPSAGAQSHCRLVRFISAFIAFEKPGRAAEL